MVGALGACPALWMQVCWKQPFWKDDVIASQLRMATTRCGGNADPEKLAKLQAVSGTMSKTPDILCLSF